MFPLATPYVAKDPIFFSCMGTRSVHGPQAPKAANCSALLRVTARPFGTTRTCRVTRTPCRHAEDGWRRFRRSPSVRLGSPKGILSPDPSTELVLLRSIEEPQFSFGD